MDPHNSSAAAWGDWIQAPLRDATSVPPSLSCTHCAVKSSKPMWDRGAGSSPGSGLRLWQEHDLAARVALRKLTVCVAHLIEREGARDRDLDLALGDELRQLSQQLRSRDRVRALGLDTVALCGLEVGDRVYSLARDAQLEGKLHIAASERIDEGVDLP